MHIETYLSLSALLAGLLNSSAEVLLQSEHNLNAIVDVVIFIIGCKCVNRCSLVPEDPTELEVRPGGVAGMFFGGRGGGAAKTSTC